MLAVYSIVVGGAIVEVGDIVVGGDLVDDDVVPFSLLCILSLNNCCLPIVRIQGFGGHSRSGLGGF